MQDPHLFLFFGITGFRHIRCGSTNTCRVFMGRWQKESPGRTLGKAFLGMWAHGKTGFSSTGSWHKTAFWWGIPEGFNFQFCWLLEICRIGINTFCRPESWPLVWLFWVLRILNFGELSRNCALWNVTEKHFQSSFPLVTSKLLRDKIHSHLSVKLLCPWKSWCWNCQERSCGWSVELHGPEFCADLE